jgi:predicted aspartyl protease
VKRAMLLILLVVSISGRLCSEAQAVSFRLQRGYLIVVKCTIGDLPDLTGIVDTGVTESVVDKSLVERLSLKTREDRATFLTREAPVWAVSIPSLQLGPLRTGPLAGIATDLSTLTGQFGIRPDILIGMDVLHRANFLIDFKARQLLFIAVPSLAHAAPLIHDQRSALVESMVMGKRTVLQVDTGFQGLLLYGERPSTFGGQASSENQIVTPAHTLMAASLCTGEVRIGNWRTSSLEVSVIDAPRHLVGFDGLIGPQALSAHRLAFDFENNLLSWD